MDIIVRFASLFVLCLFFVNVSRAYLVEVTGRHETKGNGTNEKAAGEDWTPPDALAEATARLIEELTKHGLSNSSPFALLLNPEADVWGSSARRSDVISVPLSEATVVARAAATAAWQLPVFQKLRDAFTSCAAPDTNLPICIRKGILRMLDRVSRSREMTLLGGAITLRKTYEDLEMSESSQEFTPGKRELISKYSRIAANSRAIDEAEDYRNDESGDEYPGLPQNFDSNSDDLDTPDVSISRKYDVKENEGSDATQEINASEESWEASSEGDVGSRALADGLDEAIMDKLVTLAASREVSLRIPPAALDSVRHSVEEFRGSKGKGRLPLLLLMGLMMKGTLTTMALGTIAMIAGKALTVGLMALTIASVIGLKKLFSHDSGGSVEVVKVASDHHGRHMSEGPLHLDPYRAHAPAVAEARRR